MPHSALHEKKKKSNLIILSLIIGWCVVIFALAIIKMKVWI